MIMLSRFLGLILLFLSSTVQAYTKTPEPLDAYIKGGRFDPGDYAWMRGRFNDATDADKRDYQDIMLWLNQCTRDARADAKAKLNELGIPNPLIDNVPVGPVLCSQVAQLTSVGDKQSFGAFQRSLAKARLIADTYLAAARVAEGIVDHPDQSLAEQLIVRPLGEQMTRFAMSWGQDNMTHVPELTAEEKIIFLSLIGSATAERDHANSEWLKTIVEAHGWPKRSAVGERASQAAWLLAQHADADPVFQLQVLRLMEPLVEQREVSPANYAYLYDRVMLKLAGTQRYATQAQCRGGKRQPLPLESEYTVAEERQKMGLTPLESYLQFMDERFGPCPPE